MTMTMTMTRSAPSVYALVDCDAFFCSCERLFRPEYVHRPVIVLSNNDGCAVSRTKEAKALGIAMGAPYFQIRQLCEQHQVGVFSSNFSLYTDISARVMRLLRQLAPRVEVYSVDEAFLDLSGVPNVMEYGRMIREKIGREVGIPISIGIAPTKSLCKAGCFLAKQDGARGGVVSLLDESLRDQVLASMPVEKLWGIAKGRGRWLHLAGIKNARQFRDFNNDRYIQKILSKVGRQIQDELRGIVCYPITLEREKKKQIMSSRTFGNSVYDYRALAESVATHASEVAQELRAQGSVCGEVMVFVRSNPFKEGIEQYGKSGVYRFETPTASTFRLIEGALHCLQELYRPGIEYKKSGVCVGGLQDDDEFALGLFEAPDSAQETALMQAMDRINLRQGPRTLHSLACGVSDGSWRMNRQFKSPRYTTCWRELPTCS